MADISLDETQEVIIRDSATSNNELKVNADGSINVNAGVTPPPPLGTSVIQNVFGSISSTAGSDQFYVIPDGKTLTIQTFTGGAEPHNSGSIVELFTDPTGTGSPITRIETVFVNGSSAQVDVNEEFVGNGTSRIILRRRVYVGSPREVWGRWRGYTV